MDIKDLKTYWTKKYPQVDVNIWDRYDKDGYVGSISHNGERADISADTLGQLIIKGEDFLRKVKR